ncbi:MAG: hypothetical protein IJJ40_01945 [Clostridia bacterium]|nr:hypothetical protein [Clostridia bacterium]
MKKRVFFLSVYFLAFLITAVNVFFSLKNYLVVDINELPVGTLVSETASPSGEKEVKVYRVENTLGTAIRGELIIGGTPHNIFWQTGIDDISVEFTSDEIVQFNNVPLVADGKNSYDCRKGTALFTGGALEDELINENE